MDLDIFLQDKCNNTCISLKFTLHDVWQLHLLSSHILLMRTSYKVNLKFFRFPIRLFKMNFFLLENKLLYFYLAALYNFFSILQFQIFWIAYPVFFQTISGNYALSVFLYKVLRYQSEFFNEGIIGLSSVMKILIVRKSYTR